MTWTRTPPGWSAPSRRWGEAVERERERATRELERRQARYPLLVGFTSVLYLLLIAAVWRWSAINLVRPIGALTRAATGDQPFPEPEERAPAEIAVLGASLRRYAASLEAETRALAESERASRDAAARTRGIMEAAPSAILVADAGGKILTHNTAASTVLGIGADASLEGQPIAPFLPDHDFRAEGRTELEARRANGDRFPLELATARFELDGEPAFALVGHDRTQQQRLEQELRQSQKQEALGQLAAGLAHELNTPIQFVGDCIHFFRDAFSDLMTLLDDYRARTDALDPEAREALARQEEEIDLPFLRGEIPAASERTLDGLKSASELIRATQELVHPEGGADVACDAHDAIRSAVRLVRHRFEPVAELALRLHPVPLAHCGHGELVQVVVNLLSNAVDAIGTERPTPGRITVSCELEEGRVAIRVQDDGPGIAEDIALRIFDPFFTTKPVGDGTGQGALDRPLDRRGPLRRHPVPRNSSGRGRDPRRPARRALTTT